MRRVGDEAADRPFGGLGPLKGCLERVDHAIERIRHLPELGVGVRRRKAAAAMLLATEDNVTGVAGSRNAP